MAPKTKLGKFRKMTSGDGRKNFDSDVKKDLKKTIEEVEKDLI